MDADRTAPEARDWSPQAACKGNLGLFYAPHGERPQARERREADALRVCARCPVLEPCRLHARSHHELGLWGGETEQQRTDAGFAPRPVSVATVRRSISVAS